MAPGFQAAAYRLLVSQGSDPFPEVILPQFSPLSCREAWESPLLRPHTERFVLLRVSLHERQDRRSLTLHRGRYTSLTVSSHLHIKMALCLSPWAGLITVP